ncbi:MAG: amidohydrolase family protein [Planctomycetaceae bacterium]|nr:amidohydrolase family protein [Planctomycetaceae bacterium]
MHAHRTRCVVFALLMFLGLNAQVHGQASNPGVEAAAAANPVQPRGPLTAYVGANVRTGSAAGIVKNATILVADGLIVEIGEGLQPPPGARVIDWAGKTVLPGIIDPYYVDSSLRASGNAASEVRRIEVGGRTIELPQQGAAESTELLRITDVWNPPSDSSRVALRSGITTLHWVTSGYGMSLFSPTQFESRSWHSTWGERLFVAANNNAESLELIRRGLAGQPVAPPSNSERSGPPGGGGRGRRPPRQDEASIAESVADGFTAETHIEADLQDPNSTPNATAPETQAGEASVSVAEPLWVKVRAGEVPLLINASNSATILHVLKVLEAHEKVRVALVANPADVYQVRSALSPARLTLIVRPRLEKVANSAARVNIAKELGQLSIPFCFSLSTNQADFQQSQDTPLFPVTSLVRTGLDANRAVEALTMQPAKLLGIDKWVGSLEANKFADMIVFDHDPLVSVGSLEQVFLKGKLVYENR